YQMQNRIQDPPDDVLAHLPPVTSGVPTRRAPAPGRPAACVVSRHCYSLIHHFSTFQVASGLKLPGSMPRMRLSVARILFWEKPKLYGWSSFRILLACAYTFFRTSWPQFGPRPWSMSLSRSGLL